MLKVGSEEQKTLLTERLCLVICIALGAVQAWILRYVMISDGVSYLDIGDAYMRGDWKAAVNALWSPLYSWCLGLALYLLKPSIWWEFVVVHIVNLVIYVAALFCFRFFLRSVLRSLREGTFSVSDDSAPLPEKTMLILGYSLFLWGSMVLIDLGRVTPDLLAAALIFLIAGCLVELSFRPSYPQFALFGALCGATYLDRSIMLPVGFGLLVIELFSGKRSKARVAGFLLSVAVFLLVCAPFVLILSKAKGRFTFGDAGRLNYASLVSPGTMLIHWQGEPTGSGTPLHPTRKLLEDPPVFEFSEPVRGTYPPWDDPSYWNEGMQWSFHLRPQLRVLMFNTVTYVRILIREPGLLAGVLIYLVVGGKGTRRAIAANWPLLGAAGLTLAAYSLVHVIDRYIGASMVLLFVAILAGVRLPKDLPGFETASKYLAAAIALSVLLTVTGYIFENTYTTLTVSSDPPAKDQVRTALGLEGLGLRPGDKVAVVGYGYLDHWARLGRFRIVAEAAAAGPQAREFWASSPERRNLAYECLSGTEAKAVIAWDPPQSALDPRWKKISSTDYYVYFFHK